MMLRTNGQYFDFNSIIEVDRRVKLFEEIDQTLGDFSYSFNMEPTARNIALIGTPLPDVKNKTIYRKIITDIVDESGLLLYTGFLKVERIARFIECSFFSGNHNWMSLLNNPLSDLDLSDLETLLTEAEIVNSADNTEGIIFPVLDTGALITRSNSTLMLEDFSGCIFVKTLFKRIFQSIGVKTDGDLFKDPRFDNLLLSRVTLGPEDIKSLSCYVRNTVDQTITTPNGTFTSTKIQFNDDSNYPYYDGSADAYDSNPAHLAPYRYTAPIKEKIKVEATVIHKTDAPLAFLTINKIFQIHVNGVAVYSKRLNPLPAIETDSATHLLTLQTGDYMEAFIRIENTGVAPQDVIIYKNSTIRITPTFIYRTKGQSLVPNWTQGQLVGNILNLFCCVTDYAPATKGLTIDFFENIKDKESIDLSDHIEAPEIDYSEFISNFGKKSLLTYKNQELDNVKQYNLSQVVAYGAGEIEVENDYIEDTAEILSSDFKAPISYLNSAFSASLERTEFVELEENGDQNFTAVTDASSEARFTVADATIYEYGELVRITESTNAGYDGDYVVSTVGVGFIHVRGLGFNTDATGKITKLLHRIGSDDGVYLFINTKYRVDNVSQFSKNSNYFLVLNDYPNFAYAFFNLLNTGMPINNNYRQSMSFGSVDDPLSYQRSLVDDYWQTVRKVLNDPVKLLTVGHLPKLVYSQITPLRPIRIKSRETNNLYYANLIRGYKGSQFPCDLELIKLS